MSNKEQLQENNTALAGYITRVNAAKETAANLPEASGGSYPFFDGEYNVTPAVDEQKLETAKKVMRENLTVLAIPYAEVSNLANGKTVTIG